jgi:hypothetical protein
MTALPKLSESLSPNLPHLTMPFPQSSIDCMFRMEMMYLAELVIYRKCVATCRYLASSFALGIRLLDTRELPYSGIDCIFQTACNMTSIAAYRCGLFRLHDLQLFMDCIVSLRFRSPILRSIPDVISADSFSCIYRPPSAFDLATVSLRSSYALS